MFATHKAAGWEYGASGYGIIGTVPDRSIAIFHAGALGDFIVTWFVALGLGRTFPGHEVSYITHSSKGRLGERFLGTSFNEIEVGGWHTLFGEEVKLGLQARRLMDRCDEVVSFVADTEVKFARQLKEQLPEARAIFVDPLPPASYSGHITGWYLEQLAQTFPGAHFDEALAGLARQGVGVSRSGAGRILLHPGSGAVKKCWPLESYLALARRLRHQGADVAVILGEAELERYSPRLTEQLCQEYTVLCPRDFVALAEELLNAKLLITNDNGPGHLAGVLGVDVLSLFGPSNPRLWRPVGPRGRVLYAENLAALPVDEVMEIVAA